MACAIYADLTHAVVRRRRPLRVGAVRRRRGRRPDLVLLDLSATNVAAELAFAWTVWGERVVVAGVDRRHPYARIWSRPELAEVVELGPGFLAPFLPPEGLSTESHPGAVTGIACLREMGDAAPGVPG